MKDNSRIAAGYFAGLTGFHAGTINSPAVYESPALPPPGIKSIYRDGAKPSSRITDQVCSCNPNIYGDMLIL